MVDYGSIAENIVIKNPGLSRDELFKLGVEYAQERDWLSCHIEELLMYLYFLQLAYLWKE